MQYKLLLEENYSIEILSNKKPNQFEIPRRTCSY